MSVSKLMKLSSKAPPERACDTSCRFDAMRDRAFDRLATLKPPR